MGDLQLDDGIIIGEIKESTPFLEEIKIRATTWRMRDGNLRQNIHKFRAVLTEKSLEMLEDSRKNNKNNLLA